MGLVEQEEAGTAVLVDAAEEPGRDLARVFSWWVTTATASAIKGRALSRRRDPKEIVGTLGIEGGGPWADVLVTAGISLGFRTKPWIRKDSGRGLWLGAEAGNIRLGTQRIVVYGNELRLPAQPYRLRARENYHKRHLTEYQASCQVKSDRPGIGTPGDL